jgi:uncharacterized protein (DUF2236 family)
VTVLAEPLLDADPIARAARIMAAAADLVDDAARLSAALDRYHQKGVTGCASGRQSVTAVHPDRRTAP